MTKRLLDRSAKPDWEALRDCINRSGTPDRVHNIELYLDQEVQAAVVKRFDLDNGISPNDPYGHLKIQINIQRFLGYDYVRCRFDDQEIPLNMRLKRNLTEDTASMRRATGRRFMVEGRGPITSWEEFEEYPWPNVSDFSTRSFEWYEKNLPDDMCLVSGYGQFSEFLSWLMGYESLCYSLYDQRELVSAISKRLLEIHKKAMSTLLTFERVKFIFPGDDMGFRSGTLISPQDLNEFVLPGHQKLASMAHDAGRLYLLHSCGNIQAIMEQLIDQVGIDAKHSFEDTIENVVDAKKLYGSRIALLGGIDVDFLCKAGNESIRGRVRETLKVCHPGGGYCLGTGNSVANYIPLESYLIMLDEGRRFT
jgi:uroporphyrinogen decarboxylase